MTKRNQNNNKHNFTEVVAGGGGHNVVFCGGGAELEVTPLDPANLRPVCQWELPPSQPVRNIQWADGHIKSSG